MKLPNSGIRFFALAALGATAFQISSDVSAGTGSAKKGDGTYLCTFSSFTYDTTTGVMQLTGCVTGGTPTPTPRPTPTPTTDTFSFALPLPTVVTSSAAQTVNVGINFTRVTFTGYGQANINVGLPCTGSAATFFSPGVNSAALPVGVPASTPAGTTCTLSMSAALGASAVQGPNQTLTIQAAGTPTSDPSLPPGCPTPAATLNRSTFFDVTLAPVTGFGAQGQGLVFGDSSQSPTIIAVALPKSGGAQVASGVVQYVGWSSYPQNIEAALSKCPGDFTSSLSSAAAVNQYSATFYPCHSFGEGGSGNQLYWNTTGDYLSCAVPNDGTTWYLNMRYVAYGYTTKDTTPTGCPAPATYASSRPSTPLPPPAPP